MLNKAKQFVSELMKNDNSGHGMQHINRVYNLAMKFAQKENCDITVVALGALLHDVDDYKLFGDLNQEKLINTNKILSQLNVDKNTKEQVLNLVSTIGYSKRLKGIIPSTIEAKIVSDADMCDAIGVIGILRTHQYNIKHGKNFFDRNIWPVENIDAHTYTKKAVDSSVCHIFEKGLKIKSLMLTEYGKIEACLRHNFMIDFLRQLFKEENAPEWEQYLDNYLKKLN